MPGNGSSGRAGDAIGVLGRLEISARCTPLSLPLSRRWGQAWSCAACSWLRQRVDEGLTCVIEADIASSPGASYSLKRTVYLEAQLLSHADVRDLLDKRDAQAVQGLCGSEHGRLPLLRFRYDASTRNRQEERLLHGQQQPVTVTPTGAGARWKLEPEVVRGGYTGSLQCLLQRQAARQRHRHTGQGRPSPRCPLCPQGSSIT